MFSFLTIMSEANRTSDGATASESIPFDGPTQIFLVTDRVPQHDLPSLSYLVVLHLL